jgi:hypothetical protein
MNAKEEFLKEIEGKELVCAKIGVEDRNDYSKKIWHTLKDSYTKEDFDEFCSKLDFEYDDGYGGQELFGVILFKDSYSDRYEYDGSESWDYHKIPTVQEILDFEV